MEYSIGSVGRVVVMKFSQDDDFMYHIEDICKREKIYSALFQIIGGVNRADIVSGPSNEGLPPKAIWSSIDKKSEILGTGTVFLTDGTPKIHLHAAVAKGDNIKMGCIRGSAKSFLVTEVVLFEITGIDAKRVMDEKSGFNLLTIFSAK